MKNKILAGKKIYNCKCRKHMTLQRTALSVAVSMLCSLPLQQNEASTLYLISYKGKPMFELQVLNAGENMQKLPDAFSDGEEDEFSTAQRNLKDEEISGLIMAGSLWAEILGPGTVNTSPVKVQVLGLDETYENASATSLPNLNVQNEPENVVGPIGQFTMNEPAQLPAYVFIGEGLDFIYPTTWHTLPDGDGFDYAATVFHEFGHALGIGFIEDYELNFNNFLYDCRGVQYSTGKELVALNSYNTDDSEENIFLVGDGAQSGVYFKGQHVNEVLAGSDLKGIPVNGVEDDGCGNQFFELSHFELDRSMMSHQNYRNYTFFMEAELAALQDLGYTIDRKNFYGRSIYANNQTIVNTQSFYARTADGNAYINGQPNTATLGTGLHVYGKNNKITQAADLLAGGTGGVGIRVDGSENKITIADAVQVRADGLNGTGVLFAYGSDQELNAQGTITALGEGGVALRFDFGGNLLGNETEYRGSYIWTYFDEKDVFNSYCYFDECSGEWSLAKKDNNGFEITNFGALMSKVNIAGTVAGSAAAVYISDNALVQEINVLPGAQIVGNIISNWDPDNEYITAFVKENKDFDLTTDLIFGAGDTDRKFAMTLYGSIYGPESLDVNLTDGELTVLGTTQTLSLSNNGKLSLLGSDANGYALKTQTISLGENSVLRLPSAANVSAESAKLDGTLTMLLPRAYYSNNQETKTSLKIEYNNKSEDNFDTVKIDALSPTLNITNLESGSNSNTGQTEYFASGKVYRNPDAYARYADSVAAASTGYALVHLADSADSPYADLISALDFSSMSGSSIRKALHSVSAESYSAAAQASLRLLNAQDRKLFYRQWADPVEEIYGTQIYGDVLYSAYDSDGAAWESDGYSAIIGADTKLNRTLTLGVNLTLSSLNTDIKGNNDADVKAQSALLGLRALYRPQPDGFYLQGSIRGGMQYTDMDRIVSVNDYRATMDSDWLSFVGTVQTAVGYDLLFTNDNSTLCTGPFAAAHYSLIRTSDINESGSAAINIDGTTYDSLPLTLGWRFKLQQELASGSTFMLFADTAYFYDVTDDKDHTAASFRYTPALSFDSELERDGRSGVYLNSGAELELASGFSAGLTCGAETGSDLTGFNVSADFNYRF